MLLSNTVKRRNKSCRFSLAAATLASLTVPQLSNAAGFAIIEQGVSGLGQAYAGAAAVAEDATTVFFNPAGMTYLDGDQVLTAVHVIKTSAEFNDEGTVQNGAVPLGTDDGGDAGDTSFVPNFYYVTDFGEWKFGLGVNAPFGLKTEYDDDWVGRYAAIKSEMKTVNINPSIAYKANDKLSIGVGFNIQYIDAELTNATNVGVTEGETKLEGDDWSAGINFGVIYEISDATRLGVAYRGEVRHTLEGDADITGTGAVDDEFDISADIDLPSTFSISMAHSYSDKLMVLADVTHTKWSNFQELRVINEDADTVARLVEEKWTDSYRYSLGLRYQYDNAWTLRTGIALDETPIRDKYRTARIPGDERKWLTLGASYTPNNNLTVDVAYAHLWVGDAEISEEWNQGGANNGTLIGDYDADVDILSVQASWKF